MTGGDPSNDNKNSSYNLVHVENPGSKITQVSFNGTNYDEWSRAIHLALLAKGKFGYVDGNISKPSTTDATLDSWLATNALVTSWLYNTIEPSLRKTISYRPEARLIWIDIKTRFSQGNDARLYKLQSDLLNCRQGPNESIMTYYGRLMALWDDILEHNPLPSCACKPCACNWVTVMDAEREKQRARDFLMGLDDKFDNARSQILGTSPLPSLNLIYNRLLQEEGVRNFSQNRLDLNSDVVAFAARATSGSRGGRDSRFDKSDRNVSSNSDQPSKYFCPICQIDGHSLLYCFKVTGKFPEYWGARPRDRVYLDSSNPYDLSKATFVPDPKGRTPFGQQGVLGSKSGPPPRAHMVTGQSSKTVPPAVGSSSSTALHTFDNIDLNALNPSELEELSKLWKTHKSGSSDQLQAENKKGDYGGAVTDLRSFETVEDSECNIVFNRKQDPSDSVEKPAALNGFRDVKSSKKQTTVLGEKVRDTGSSSGSILSEISADDEIKNVSGTIKILSYNVWFRDELEGYLRMQAIGNLIQLHSPDVICFQEVNSVLYDIFQRSSWWKKYRCSVSFERSQNEAYFCMQLAKIPVKSFSRRPFSYTVMSRELCITQLELNNNKSLVIATSHLESPCPGPPKWDQMYSKERVNQAKEAITFLEQFPNVIFCGDMNWDDKRDGQFPFTEGWFDAWEKLRPAEVGYTYDTKSNRMLSGNWALQKRLDRFVCHLADFKVSKIEMIGTEAIPGLEYKKEKRTRGKIQELTLPVYPSDHYGLLLTVTSG